MQTLLRRFYTPAHGPCSSVLITQTLADAASNLRCFSAKSTTKNGAGDDDEWNTAWETAWLPESNNTICNRAPWEADVNFPAAPQDSSSNLVLDEEAKAFVEDMNQNWDQRKKQPEQKQKQKQGGESKSLYSLETIKRDYRVKKQRINAALWMKEIEKQEEAKLGDPAAAVDDIDRLLDSCNEIFDSPDNDLINSKIPSTSEYKHCPDGWETGSKDPDGSVWEMSQREEDVLLQEFDRRIAFCKFQIAGFIKSHIFSRRRPIDGWKYMIEELGPNAKKGKGSVSRIPSLADESTQPLKEDKLPITRNLTSFKGR